MRRFIAAHRCPRCEIIKPLCFCDRIPAIQTQTRVLIMMHTCEEVLTSNTAKLAAQALTHCELRIHGRQHETMSAEGVSQSGRTSLLLFPSPYARELSAEFVASLTQPVNLLVPDGSWTRATKFIRRAPYLRGVQHVKVPLAGPSEYHLRKQSSAENLCTLEAIARALGALESPSIQRQLETLLSTLVERTLLSRGKIKVSDCVYSSFSSKVLSGHHFG